MQASGPRRRRQLAYEPVRAEAARERPPQPAVLVPDEARRLAEPDLHGDADELAIVDDPGQADPDRQPRPRSRTLWIQSTIVPASKQIWLMMSVAISDLANIARIVSSSGIRWWLSG